MRDLLVGLDVGTSAVDACAFEPGGRLVARATRPLDTAYPRPGRAEQDPSSWTDGAVGAARCLAARLGPDVRSIAAVGLTGQCPSLALVDESGRPLTPGVIYQDTRATAEAARLSATLDAADVLARAGMAPSHYYLAAKVMWLAAHRPDLRTQRPWLAQPRDLVAQRLTGLLATDPTHAGCSGLYDLPARAWAATWAERLGLSWLRLPPVRPPETVLGPLTAAAAAETGLPRGVPVIIGAADNFCADLAMGAVKPGLLGDSTGTTTCLDLSVDQCSAPNPALALYAHFAPGLLFANTGLNATGAVVAWAAATLAGGNVARLEALAATAAPDAAAPLFVPYLGGGERADAGASGAWHGLTLAHGPAQLARSIYEGLTFALCELLDHFRAAGWPITQARIGGGGSRSALWNRIKADVWGLPVRTATSADTSSLGAAMLAGVAIGIYEGLDDAVGRAVRLGPLLLPDPERAAFYGVLYGRWRALRSRPVGLEVQAHPLMPVIVMPWTK